jgi:hypothetical protein
VFKRLRYITNETIGDMFAILTHLGTPETSRAPPRTLSVASQEAGYDEPIRDLPSYLPRAVVGAALKSLKWYVIRNRNLFVPPPSRHSSRSLTSVASSSDGNSDNDAEATITTSPSRVMSASEHFGDRPENFGTARPLLMGQLGRPSPLPEEMKCWQGNGKLGKHSPKTHGCPTQHKKEHTCSSAAGSNNGSPDGLIRTRPPGGRGNPRQQVGPRRHPERAKDAVGHLQRALIMNHPSYDSSELDRPQQKPGTRAFRPHPGRLSIPSPQHSAATPPTSPQAKGWIPWDGGCEGGGGTVLPHTFPRRIHRTTR